MSRDTEALFNNIINGDRIALGQVMTLTESHLDGDRKDAMDVLLRCERKLEAHDPSFRFAISGAPGAGKSTFIEALGMNSIQSGHKVGVLTIDPTSSLSHGSILGDKSRMTQLSTHENAFIRSTSAGDVLGGLGRRSMELMTLLAASGYDLVLLETVGVGQSEHTTWQFTDGFILVIQPGAGDELQGIKRGITELADIVVVNKADRDLVQLAKVAKAQYETALHFFSSTRDGWVPKIITCSSLDNIGIDDAWEALRFYIAYLEQQKTKRQDRVRQKLNWLDWSIRLTAQELVTRHSQVRQKMEAGQKRIQSEPSTAFTVEFEIEKLMTDLFHSTESSVKPN
jgi:LAO/AO transport system kinase